MIISGVICRKWFGTGNRCNFVDELRVKRRAAFPLPKCCPYILTLWIREKTEPTAGDMFTCYVAGCTDDYFWCNLQEMVWYRQ